MRIIANKGTDRAVDQIAGAAVPADASAVTTSVSVFGISALQGLLPRNLALRLLLSADTALTDDLLGGRSDRSLRNSLTGRRLAADAAQWVASAQVRVAQSRVPQSTFMLRDQDGAPTLAMVGACALTTSGLGVTPADPFSLLQTAETMAELTTLASWFEEQWRTLGDKSVGRDDFLNRLSLLADRRSASEVHLRILDALFNEMGEALDEERIVRSATGIRDTTVWSKLYRFQRDGVVGAIDKLQRYGGCIIADSVGLGKTFEALAVIKYHELRNDRVLVLCPKRLRDNWTLWKANDRRNSLAGDRFNYDVLNHTDLSRDGGMSGDIQLSHVNWGNYDLVVIDESHNFRNRAAHKDKEGRYDRLMRQIIKAGVKTRVLMLSATPVNNRLADIKNQIAFATEGNDAALAAQNIPSIEATIRFAQGQFNRWQEMPEARRTSARLLDMLGFDYFRLLDLMTIARSRKHVERYYGTSETGTFPTRLAPLNIKADVDSSGTFPPIGEINNAIRRLNLAVYAPLRYVLDSKKKAYDEKYSQQVRGGGGVFSQLDREESLVHLLRVNLLKRMESSVASFAMTLRRQLEAVDALIAKIDAHEVALDEPSIDDLDLDDPLFEALAVGRRVRVLLADADRVRWRQDLDEDRAGLSAMLVDAEAIIPDRDAKLARLRSFIAEKVAAPFNPGNRKIIVFTAFADTARYLYDELVKTGDANTALVTGSGGNRTTIKGLRSDLGSILTAFSPRSKGRPDDMADEGEIDLLIATDVISEGQNLQDCDCLINYDIHWNPVRIVQRFGRIDRIGSVNDTIQLVNFWPNVDLDTYIGLEKRVSGRMKLLDVSATGEENIIEPSSGDVMNDLDYRRRQLEALQTTVIDLEDLSSGVSIADMTLNDLRADFAALKPEAREAVALLPLTAHAAVWADDEVPAGAIFCLRAETPKALAALSPNDPLRPHVVVHVGPDGEILLTPSQAKRALDRTKYLADRGQTPDDSAWDRLDAMTRQGRVMKPWQDALAAAVAAVSGKAEERAIDSLFSAGVLADPTGFAGMEDWEVVGWFAVLERQPEE
ncbi:helicase [Brevundimonas mediterranea]|uniref:Helicase n=1 Tax=Brevundimonas mediterranea TaxID=74329 RepID=A0AB37E5R7_9CAUL|nr:helicase-related protein [Brevundimonas mediterranea]QIH72655.1 helicase [Brevundimonas mediterranea]